MKYKAIWMLFFSLVCLAVSAERMIPAYQEVAAINKESGTSPINTNAKRERMLAVIVNRIGEDYLWYLGNFVLFGFAMNYAHSHVRRWWAKLAFAVPTLLIFILATAFFMVAGESTKFISGDARAGLFEAIIKIKISMVLVGLFIGRLCFDMFKPFISKESV